MTWKDRSKETQSVYQCLAVVFAIHLAIGLYLIAGMDAQERKQRNYAEFVKQMAQMDDVRQEAGGRARAIKEVGDGNVRVHN